MQPIDQEPTVPTSLLALLLPLASALGAAASKLLELWRARASGKKEERREEAQLELGERQAAREDFHATVEGLKQLVSELRAQLERQDKRIDELSDQLEEERKLRRNSEEESLAARRELAEAKETYLAGEAARLREREELDRRALRAREAERQLQLVLARAQSCPAYHTAPCPNGRVLEALGALGPPLEGAEPGSSEEEPHA